MADHATMALIIAPRRRVLHDLKANSAPIFVTIGVLLAFILLSSLIMSSLEGWSFMHSAYFTVINVTTVGFGDVTAATQAGKVWSGVNAFAGLVILGCLVALITIAFQPGEFSGTATPVRGSQALIDADPGLEASPTDRAVAGLLKSVGRLLDTTQEVKDGTITVAVRTHDQGGAHVFVEVLVRHGVDA